MSASLPKGFTIRAQGGSTFLEIDLSHFDYEGINELAQAVARTCGYTEKPQRRAWRGRRPPRHHPAGKSHKAAQRPATAH